MKQKFLEEITGLPYSADEGTQFNFIMSIIRSILQHSSYSAIEYWYKFSSNMEDTDYEIAKQLLSPSDGAFISVIDRILPEIRNNLWPNCADAWFRKIVKDFDGRKLEIESLVDRINEWIVFRNNRPGHGVIDIDTVINSLQWLNNLARDLVIGLEDLIPIRESNNDGLKLKTPNGELILETLKQINDSPIVIRDIRNRGSSWRVRYQTLSIYKSTEGFYEINELSPFIKACLTSSSLYKCYNIRVLEKSWRPTMLLPQRQTSIFYGRDDQLSSLEDWYNDIDSHACLVYGEGGIGKTTLVLEFFNDLIENPKLSIKWFPAVICYFSAKQTRWGIGGLEYIRGISPVIEDAIRQLVNVLENHLDRSWHSSEAKSLIDRAVTLFREAGINRNDILLILDNTETLARSSVDEEKLANLLRQISSKLCRLLMTSRRYERVEAHPIRVPPMNDETGKALLKRLGEVYGSQPIKQAGDTRLKKITKQLAGRPLLLDIFARYSSYAGRSLDDSLRLVLRDTRKDLGEFLFEDAWQRITEPHRNVFMALGQFGNTVNGKIAGWICVEFGVPHDLWLETFDETRFGNLVDYGTEYDIYFDASMREFLAKKCMGLTTDHQRNITKIVSEVNKKYKPYLIAQDSDISDRVIKAFRTTPAKAAKLAAKKGDIEEAVFWYEEATSVDSVNADLWDRFAWFLMAKVGNFERATDCSKTALRLDSNNADFYFTAGMIAARKKEINEADELLKKAADLGKAKYLCLIERARARIEYAAPDRDINDWRELLTEADNFIKEAKELPMNYRYESKNQLNCELLLERSNNIRLIRMRKSGSPVRPKSF